MNVAASDSCLSSVCANEFESGANNRGDVYSNIVRSFANIARPATDVLIATSCTFVASGLSRDTSVSLRQSAIASVIVGIVAAFSRVQSQNSSLCNLAHIRETEIILRAATWSQAMFFCVNLLLGRHIHAWAYFLCLLVTASSMFMVQGVITRLLRRLHRAGYGADSVVIYGHAETTKQVAAAMLRSPECGFHPVAIIHDDSLIPADSMFRSQDGFCQSIPISNGPLTSTKLNPCQCSLLILAAPYLSNEEIARASDIAQERGIHIAVPSATLEDENPLEKIEIDGLRLRAPTRMIFTWRPDFLKRTVDVTIALLLMILGAPIFFVIAVCIKLDSRGPVLFVQKRVGRNGEIFNIFKFRSMHVNSPVYEASPTVPTDPRITRFGRLLRRSGLDESAQLLNVLLGNMSLVGPRPEMPFLVERHMRQHRYRLQVIPGITGLWQLSTDRAFPIHQNTQYDRFYIRNRTCFMDAAIILHTLFFAMRGGV